eukprot:11170166-Lingulodinium_polyedra.AAC.1
MRLAASGSLRVNPGGAVGVFVVGSSHFGSVVAYQAWTGSSPSRPSPVAVFAWALASPQFSEESILKMS